MQDYPFHENTHTIVSDTRKYKVSNMEEPKEPWKCKGGGWCARLRETIKIPYKDNDVQFCPHEEGFHDDSGP